MCSIPLIICGYSANDHATIIIVAILIPALYRAPQAYWCVPRGPVLKARVTEVPSAMHPVLGICAILIINNNTCAGAVIQSRSSKTQLS